MALVAAPAVAGAQEPTPTSDAPSFSLAFERVGGISYARVAEDSDNNENDSSASLTTFGVGIGNLNPYAFSRLGGDYVSQSGLTFGAGLGIARYSASSKDGAITRDQGSVTAYLLNPRVGYRIAVSPRFDFTPRIGVTFMGGRTSDDDGSSKASIFAVGLGAEGVAAYRLTNSFNLLAGASYDHTVSASATSEYRDSTGASSDTDKIKASFLSAQLWLGVGGYL